MGLPEEDQPLVGTLKRVAYQLKQLGVPFALAGSFAVYARGGEPVDHDVDFVILPDDVRLDQARWAEEVSINRLKSG